MKQNVFIAIAILTPLACPARAASDFGPYAVQTVLDVTYGPRPLTGSVASGWVSGNTLDEFLPQPTAGQWAGPYPGIVFIHGGNWQQG